MVHLYSYINLRGYPSNSLPSFFFCQPNTMVDYRATWQKERADKFSARLPNETLQNIVRLVTDIKGERDFLEFAYLF